MLQIKCLAQIMLFYTSEEEVTIEQQISKKAYMDGFWYNNQL